MLSQNVEYFLTHICYIVHSCLYMNVFIHDESQINIKAKKNP